MVGHTKDSKGFDDQIKESHYRQATSYEWTLGMREMGGGGGILWYNGQTEGIVCIPPTFLGGLTSLDKDSGQMYIILWADIDLLGLTTNVMVVSLGFSNLNY